VHLQERRHPCPTMIRRRHDVSAAMMTRCDDVRSQ
jgi:hypothetical protein